VDGDGAPDTSGHVDQCIRSPRRQQVERGNGSLSLGLSI
jgi:hypothetical protein